MASTDANDEVKLFVGGLSQDTNKATLKEYFGKFGTVCDAVVMMDSQTKRSRGFGFVTFMDPEVVNITISQEHKIDGKRVDCKQACPKNNNRSRPVEQPKKPVNNNRTDKIFVGGLPDLTTDEFKEYFQSFGTVVDAILMTDRNSGKLRGFGFITFSDPSTVDEVMKNYNEHYVKGKWVEVKRAMPKDQMSTKTQWTEANQSPQENTSNAYPRYGYSDSYSFYENKNSVPSNGIYQSHPLDPYASLDVPEYYTPAYNPYATPNYTGAQRSNVKMDSSNLAQSRPPTTKYRQYPY